MGKNIIKIRIKQRSFIIMIGMAILINFGTIFSFKRTIKNLSQYSMSVTIKYIGAGKPDSNFMLFPLGYTNPNASNLKLGGLLTYPSEHEEDSLGYLVHSIISTITLPDGTTKQAIWMERKATGKDIGMGILAMTGILDAYQKTKTTVVGVAKDLPGATKTGAQQGSATGAKIGGAIGGSAGAAYGKAVGTVQGASIGAAKTIIKYSPIGAAELTFEAMDTGDTMGDRTWILNGPTGDPGDPASYGINMTKQ